jgi:hypothetical protein
MPSRIAYDETGCLAYARHFLSQLEASPLDACAVIDGLFLIEKCSAHSGFDSINALRAEVEIELENESKGLPSRLKKAAVSGEDVLRAERYMKKMKYFVVRDTWEALTWRSRFYYVLNENPGDAYRNVAGGLFVAGTTGFSATVMGFTGGRALGLSLFGGVGTVARVPGRLYNFIVGRQQ